MASPNISQSERERLWQEYLDWLCTVKEERDPQHQKDFAIKIGVADSTLLNWRRNPDFLARWDAQYRRTTGSPERMQRVLDMLYETATDRTDPRQVAAAKEYRMAVEGVTPQQHEITFRKGLSEMTDEEFAEFERIAAQAVVREAGDGAA